MHYYMHIIIKFKVVVGGGQRKNLDPGFVLLGTRQQDVPVIFRALMLPDRFDPMSPSFTVRDVPTELSRPPLTSCRTDIYS